MGDTESKLELWKTEAFKRWWERDYSWEGLDDSLRDYWRSIDPAEFSFGRSGRKWSRFHLPPCDLDGTECPTDVWNEAKGEPFTRAIHDVLESIKSLTEDELREDRYFPKAECRGVVFGGPRDQDGNVTDAQPSLYGRPIFADFENAIFLSTYYAFGTIFCADFAGCVFVEDAFFSRSKFLPYVSFDNATFLASAYFFDVRAPRASFDWVNFDKGCAFASAHFGEYAYFRYSNFRARASFVRARFEGIADFEGATFHGALNRFDGRRMAALFTHALFEQGADFSSTTFEGEGRFRGDTNSMFGGPTLFTDANFNGIADFCGRRFVDAMDFGGCQFQDLALFHGSKLHPEAFFEPKSFRRLPQIEKVIEEMGREKHSLARDGGKPNQTILRRARDGLASAIKKSRRAVVDGYQKFVLRNMPLRFWWPGMTEVRDAFDREASRYEFAFRSLRLGSADNRNVEQEGMFYRLELDARRVRPNIPWFERALTAAYGGISDYGQSLTRPIGVFLAIFVLSVAVHSSLLIRGGVIGIFDHLPSIALWSLREFIPPPLVWSAQEMETAEKSYPWLKLLPNDATTSVVTFAAGTGQALAFVVLVAVFLIALRRRFRSE